MKRLAALFALLLAAVPAFAAESLSPAEARQIGQKVWENECAGTREGLVSWNAGEGFPSLGIGHFIWYPAGARGPFEESFPRLVALFEKRGLAIPAWLRGPAPWKTRAEMVRDAARVKALRDLLAAPRAIEIQTGFLVARLQAALPKMLEAAPASARSRVRRNFERLRATPAGAFALIDYVNFKGEGVLPTERYKGEGWGLLQVLGAMREEGNAVGEFSRSAGRILERRVRNAPPGRGEQRWLPGWKNRVERY